MRIEQLQQVAVDRAAAVAAAPESSRQVTRFFPESTQWELSEIDAALRRLDDGSYGMCERCGEPIRWERLDLLPMARLCGRCQYLAESGR
ncbi:MAG: TraR/DksA family transcriptional regulator [Dermatophilaceae bacterium]